MYFQIIQREFTEVNFENNVDMSHVAELTLFLVTNGSLKLIGAIIDNRSDRNVRLKLFGFSLIAPFSNNIRMNVPNYATHFIA